MQFSSMSGLLSIPAMLGFFIASAIASGVAPPYPYPLPPFIISIAILRVSGLAIISFIIGLFIIASISMPGGMPGIFAGA